MGRLTLNVLLSFAQFEREVTGERIRDKIAASKKKGMWMGGSLPLGYDVVKRKLLINQTEAIQVRRIYALYLEHGNVRLLQEDLHREGIRSKSRISSISPGGAIMSRGALYKLLANPVYCGQIRHQGICYPGQHEPIIDPQLWAAVQARLKNQIQDHRPQRSTQSSGNWLIGKLFDAAGERFTPNHCVKQGRRYQYYVSHRMVTETAGKHPEGWRLPARATEKMVMQAAQSILEDQSALASALQGQGIEVHRLPQLIEATKEVAKRIGHAQISDHAIFQGMIQRVELHRDDLRLTLCLDEFIQIQKTTSSGQFSSGVITMTGDVPLQVKRRGHEMRLVIKGQIGSDIKADKVMVKAVARSHAWAEALLTGKADSMRSIAQRERVSVSVIKEQMPLAFLAPDIVQAILKGNQPAHLSTHALIRHTNIPLDWDAQRKLLGFAASI